ncbi:tetratricopeptide repeat protein [Anaerolineae bacterium CFX7]|nr:tetratricopeptide repeat protein [Anaerolineae bacterium CFX7]
MHYTAWRLYFERVIQAPDAQINLAEGALILATDEYPNLDIAQYLAELDALANEFAPRLAALDTPHAVIAALNAYLFEELGFSGNRHAYYDPRNSYLNDVLERRAGIPISLSTLVIAIAQRLRLPIVGVGLPGHFCVKWQDAAREIVFDPFNGGEILDLDAMLARVRETALPHATFEPDWLDAVGGKYILYRMLNNLKTLFIQRGQIRRAQQAVDKMLLLDPRASAEIRDMGLLSLRLGEQRQAAIYLEQYLLAHPDAFDAGEVRALLQRALEHVERLN